VTYITLQIFLCPLPTLKVNAFESKYLGDNFIKIDNNTFYSRI